MVGDYKFAAKVTKKNGICKLYFAIFPKNAKYGSEMYWYNAPKSSTFAAVFETLYLWQKNTDILMTLIASM